MVFLWYVLMRKVSNLRREMYKCNRIDELSLQYIFLCEALGNPELSVIYCEENKLAGILAASIL